MFTNNSIQLRDYFFPKIELKDSIELKNIFHHFENIQIYPVKGKSMDYENKKKISIEADGGADQIINKTYLFKKSSFTFVVHKLNVSLTVYSLNKEDDLLLKIANLLSFVYCLDRVDIQYLSIDIYLVDQNKTIRDSTEKFTRNEINSGYCITGKTPHIVIYRKEEIFKVLIHELIHAFQYDSYEDNPKIIKHYQNKYNISSEKINSNEAYTEIWSNIINCYLISKNIGRNRYNLFLILIAMEKEFSYFQAEKVIYITKLNYDDKKQAIDINSDTNVLSYFIIRAELYKGLNKFLKFCKNHNRNYIKIENDEVWLNHLKKNELILKKNRRFNNINKNSYFFTTMRMSLNELDIYADTN
jgi:hypothetical protein